MSASLPGWAAEAVTPPGGTGWPVSRALDSGDVSGAEVSKVGEWGALALWTTTAHGDLSWSTPLEQRRALQQRLTGCPWSGVRQVHGPVVETVTNPGQQGGEADAMVTALRGAALSVLGADCGTVALASPEGVIGAAHCGWKGLVSGVLQATVERMRRLGASRVAGALGPCIHRCCYEFDEDGARTVSASVGHPLSALTSCGTPALDLPGGIGAVLVDCGVEVVEGVDACTACSPRYFSHRRDRTAGRHALAVWVP